MRADRNMYSKSLIEAQDEINELKRKFKIQAHQVRGRRVGMQTRFQDQLLLLPCAALLQI